LLFHHSPHRRTSKLLRQILNRSHIKPRLRERTRDGNWQTLALKTSEDAIRPFKPAINERNRSHEIDLLRLNPNSAFRRNDNIPNRDLEALVSDEAVSHLKQNILLGQYEPALRLAIVCRSCPTIEEAANLLKDACQLLQYWSRTDLGRLDCQRAGSVTRQRRGDGHIGPFQRQRELSFSRRGIRQHRSHIFH